MTVVALTSRAILGIEAPEVLVETHLANGLPSFTLVGLPDAEVKEARDRVRAAILSSGLEYPLKRITVNLAPADLPKSGSRFDLPIALAILAASHQIPLKPLQQYEIHGELGLDGTLRPIPGILPAALAARRAGRPLLIPLANAPEVRLIDGLAYCAFSHLTHLLAWLTGQPEVPLSPPPPPSPAPSSNISSPSPPPDLVDVRGQTAAKRALEIAAAGGHSLLLFGPPGAGKSMLAARLPALLPPLTDDEALETAALHSLLGPFDPSCWRQRPYRAPHHSATLPALIGGGTAGRILPGEISLAHGGVLFLDELPEFDRRLLEALREPLETHTITLARLAVRVTLPARFQLIAAMNPCPCGYLGDLEIPCRCTPAVLDRYRQRLSGPLLDRLDLMVETPRLPAAELLRAPPGEPTAAVAQRVAVAQARQRARQGKLNAYLTPAELSQHLHLTPSAADLLNRAAAQLKLSARVHHRLLKVARTIADLAANDAIAPSHIAEAIQLRRTPW
ncbi:MAG: YifB family Mg chelatase-like AAA ATPase [Hydrogenophilus sp.]|nr:YifB family Mg chelatase-like AAA ATPase [Hydrogenophilus sp.]